MTSFKFNKMRRKLLGYGILAGVTAQAWFSKIVFATPKNTSLSQIRPLGYVSDRAISDLSERLPGIVFTSGNEEYEQSRLVWNGTVEKHPAVIIRVRSSEDIRTAVEFAKEYNLGIAIKATGHGALVPANQDALLIDTSRMKGLSINPQEETATFESGVTAIEFLREAQKYGLAGPTAVSPGVGMTGYTLSGGYGDLPRVFGLGSDNLLSAQVILMDGRTITVSEKDYPDIFWAMRGGGGNFAIVTSMTVKVHPVTEVISGVLTFDIQDAYKVVRALREWNKII
ncbi:FAD-binding oxidoreductase, partial [Salmonella enterica subsp. enterica]|nr:FAD-binding oxidoreductase [Salmonella enterica subsp. enterica serovar Berlin]EDW0613268.1 FAD-binding oxidoreductase [Salmonella enterica subsp. enterica serovar Ball]